MSWFVVMHLFSTLLDWIRIRQLTDQEKDLEILVLRQQLRISERKLQKPIRATRAERLTLAVAINKLKPVSGCTSSQLSRYLQIFQPETVLKWHRQLVKRKWTYDTKGRGGHPKTDGELERLVVQLARENPDYGYGKIQGELGKLGYKIGEETIANILRRHNIPPAPDRGGSPRWRHLMTHYKDQILACDFFTIETLFLKTIYVLFFIEVGSRRMHFAGCTTEPHSAWMSQQARQLVWNLDDQNARFRFLIRDRDRKFSEAFDTIFRSEGMKIIPTPRQAPNANAHAERWVLSARTECFDKLIVVNQRHLQAVLTEYVDYYNNARPHQGIDQRIPIVQPHRPPDGPVQRRDVLGGIIHDYYRKAA